jgi:hypothetical protein
VDNRGHRWTLDVKRLVQYLVQYSRWSGDRLTVSIIGQSPLRRERLDRRRQVEQARVGVDFGRQSDVLVTHQFLRHARRDAGHSQPRVERHPQRVHVHGQPSVVALRDAGSTAVGIEALDEIRRNIEDDLARLATRDPRSEDVDQIHSQRQERGSAGLVDIRPDLVTRDPAVKVEVADEKLRQLADSEPGPDQDAVQVRSVRP